MKHATNSQAAKKWIALFAFIFQNSILVIALRYAAVHSTPGKTVISSTEVIFSEILKLAFSCAICFIFEANSSMSTFAGILWRGFVEEEGDILKLCVPAVLYTIQNNLQYVIESGTLFLVLYQFKIISTAIFYTTMLSRRIHSREWMLIFALAIGVGMVESSQNDIQAHHASNMAGIMSVIVAILTSGFAGVYFEKILKASKSSIWVINIELSLLGCIFGSVRTVQV